MGSPECGAPCPALSPSGLRGKRGALQLHSSNEARSGDKTLGTHVPAAFSRWVNTNPICFRYRWVKYSGACLSQKHGIVICSMGKIWWNMPCVSIWELRSKIKNKACDPIAIACHSEIREQEKHSRLCTARWGKVSSCKLSLRPILGPKPLLHTLPAIPMVKESSAKEAWSLRPQRTGGLIA